MSHSGSVQLCSSRRHHPEGEVRRREPRLRFENVSLRNHRLPAAVPGQAKVRAHPPDYGPFPLVSTATWVVCGSVSAEVSWIMTSSAHALTAATTMTPRLYNRVDSQLKQFLCCKGENLLIHWLKTIKSTYNNDFISHCTDNMWHVELDMAIVIKHSPVGKNASIQLYCSQQGT